MPLATELSQENHVLLIKHRCPLPQIVERCLVYSLQDKVASTCHLHQLGFLFVNLFSQGNDIIVNPLELGVHIAVELDNATRRLQHGGIRDVPHLFYQVGGETDRCTSLGAQSSKVDH